MTRNSLRLALSTVSVAALALSFSCSKSKVTCGEGTELEGDTCVATDGRGLGGEGGDGDGDASVPRSADIELLKEEFEGARAAGPSSNTSAVVAWDPVSVTDATFHIYVATSEDGFNFNTPQFEVPAGATSLEIAGLKKGLTHYIIIRAVVGDIEVVPEEDNVVSVKPENDDEAPAFAGVQEAESGDDATVILSWDAADDDLSPEGVISYLIYMDIEPGLGLDDSKLITPFAVTRPGATSFEVRGLPAADTEYFFVVRARDAAGNIDDNTIEVAGTSGPDEEAPVFAGCNLATPRNASALDVFWDPATDDVATEEQIVYNLYASKQADGHDFSEPSAVVVGGSQGVIEGLDKSETYHIICRAVDPSGNEESNTRSTSATTKADDQPPVFAGIQLVENLGANQVDVVWQPATDNQTQPENMVYKAFVAATEDGHDFDGDFVQSLNGASAVTVDGLDSNTPYFVIVLAEDEAGNLSAPTAPVSITTLVSLSDDISAPIFAQKCASSGCHDADTQLYGLNLWPSFEYASLVGVPRTTLTIEADPVGGFGSNTIRVVPGDPSASHIMERITSDIPAKVMPQNFDVLSEQEINTISLWISQGALNN